MEAVEDDLVGTDEEEELINEIELEMRKIHLSVEKLYNNMSVSESNDSIEKSMKANHYYSLCLRERGIEGDVDRNNALKLFMDSLSQELDFLCNDLEEATVKMNEYNVLFSRIDENISNLNAMIEAGNTDTSSVKKMADILRNIKLRFKKEKSDLKIIISSLFADNLEIQDLIARIIEHYFNEGSDKYLQLENSDNVIEHIETLRRTKLFDVNPHNSLQIRLVELT